MSCRLFGTDGIRANVNSSELKPESVAKIGRILGCMVNQGIGPNKSIVIGKDTRASGSYIEQALTAGINSAGVDCHLVGVLPTAAVAFYTKKTKSSFGVMISASHNPYSDNGLKIFNHTGFKISDSVEHFIEEQYLSDNHKLSLHPGQTQTAILAKEEYFSLLKSASPENFSLNGLKIIVDCAHGSASELAPRIFSDLGAEVIAIGTYPDGFNINNGFGSECPERIQEEVLRRNAHLGIAFDGDADRVIFIDEQGAVIDGDAILAAMAIYFKELQLLAKNTVVATVMSSFSLDKALALHDIKVVRTGVGDRLVAQAMAENGYSFGGENSGHLLMFPETTTGDGIFFALRFLHLLQHTGLNASKLVDFFKPTPKLLRNIVVKSKIPLEKLPITNEAIHQANEALKKDFGRVMLRYSGTENKARLLVEAPTKEACQEIADEIVHRFDHETNAS